MDVARAAALLEACAFDPDAAPRTFDAVSDALNLRFFHLTNLSGPTPEHLTGERSFGAVEEYLRDDVFAWDTWTHAALGAPRRHGALRFDLDLVSEDARNNAYYRDYCPRHDIAFHGGWTRACEGGQVAFAVFRGRTQGDFTAADKSDLARLVPAATRAFNLMVNLRRHHAVGLAQGLEASGQPCMLVDSRGYVTHVTPRADALLDQDFGLRNGTLFAADPSSHRQLMLIAAVAQGRVEASLLPNVIVRRPERRPLVLALSPVRGMGLEALPGARLVITITDLETDTPLDTALIQSLFEMTETEAEVAALLLTGASTEGIAAARGVRPGSVRQTIKAALAKSDTHRQSALVALLSKLSGA